MIDRGDGTGIRQWQSDALLAAEKLSGKTRTKLAAALDLGYDQYARYVNGTTPLRAEQIPMFADAYGVEVFGLARAILTGDTSTVELTWDFRAALRPQLTEAQIEQKWQRHKDEPIKDQMAAVEGYLRMAERIRTESANPPAEQPARTRRRRRSDERTARGA